MSGVPAVPTTAQIEDDPVPNLYAIERGLQHLEISGGLAALELKNARTALVEARRDLRRARVVARLKAKAELTKPTIPDLQAFVDQATDEEQFAFELAEVEVRYTADLVDERSSTRSSLQTRAKLAIECMRLAGHGGGA
ncbi:hypothetical protein [Rhodococcus sp. B10]|uniref:hypothetical protein n=1 Tax=Rhodococcus sp. B10 TaxID=2695876 RepID=UPI00142F7D5B|nr:hypothetical protein [Rhodococcus sp. B10]NIL77658.1 hypothetical protein [Rhodococcus sp. B10]